MAKKKRGGKRKVETTIQAAPNRGKVSCVSLLESTLKKAIPDITDDEITRWKSFFENKRKTIQKENSLLSAQEAMEQAGTETAKELRRASYIRKRNALINMRKLSESLEYIKTNFPDDPFNGLKAMLTGAEAQKVGTGARLSVGAGQSALFQKMLGGLEEKLKAEGVWDVFIKGDFDEPIFHALFNLDQKVAGITDKRPQGPKVEDVSPEATKAAKVIHEIKEYLRIRANDAGADISNMLGHLEQTHDPSRMRSVRKGKLRRIDIEGSRQKWKDFVRDKVDWARTLENFDESKIDEFLTSFYDSVESGVHLTSGTGRSSGFVGTRNIAAELSAGRILHFKDAASAFAYSKEFGRANLREGLIQKIDQMARDIVLMERFGTNPEETFNRIMKEQAIRIRKSDIPNRSKEAAKFSTTDQRGTALQRHFMELTGETNMVVQGKNFAAGVLSTVRGVISMSKLGRATISAVSDLGLMMHQMRYLDTNILEAYSSPFIGMMKSVTNGAERRSIASTIGIVSDTLIGKIGSRFSHDDAVSGTMSKALNFFFKMNGLQWWTDTARVSAVMGAAHRIANVSELSWKELGKQSKGIRQVLDLYGFGERQWDLMRTKLVKKLDDGNKYLVPDEVANLSKKEITELLNAERIDKGLEAKADFSEADIRRFKDKLELDMRTMFVDQVESFTVLQPTADTKAVSRRGTKGGSLYGEILRSFMQFKQFSIALHRGPLARMGSINGMIPRSMAFGHMIASMTALGYLSMSAKDALRNKSPRPLDDVRTWTAALLQGGGGGIYGDFLVSAFEKNRFGQGPISTILGPGVGAVEGLATQFKRMANGEEFMGSLFNYGISNIPFNNHFLIRPALDWLILNDIAEELRPGIHAAMQDRIRNETTQEPFFTPDEIRSGLLPSIIGE